MKILVINGIIGDSWGGLTAKQFSRMLPTNSEAIKVLISSPGGSTSEGFEIFNQLSVYAGDIEILIGPMAASIAAYIAMCKPKEKRKAFKNSGFMMHEARGSVLLASSNELKIASNKVEMTNHIMSEAFAEGTGKELKKIRKLIEEDFYLMGWEQLTDFGIVGDLVDLEDLKKDEFVYPENDESRFDVMLFGQELEKSYESRKQSVYALDDRMLKEPENAKSDFEKLVALDLSAYKKSNIVNSQLATGEIIIHKSELENNNDFFQTISHHDTSTGFINELKNTTTILTGQQPEENIIKGADKMSLQETMAKDSELNAEIQALISAKVQESNANIVEILKLEGIQLSETAIKALDTGMTAKDYAFDKLKAEQEKRADVKTESVFGELNAKQIPGDQDPITTQEVTGEETKTESIESFEKGIEETAKKIFGGNK